MCSTMQDELDALASMLPHNGRDPRLVHPGQFAGQKSSSSSAPPLPDLDAAACLTAIQKERNATNARLAEALLKKKTGAEQNDDDAVSDASSISPCPGVPSGLLQIGKAMGSGNAKGSSASSKKLGEADMENFMNALLGSFPGGVGSFEALKARGGQAPASTSKVPLEKQKFHGKRWKGEWSDPTCVAASSELARPKYDSRTTAEEYKDDKDTLDKKLDAVAELILANKKNKSTVVYSGAGLSTAAGIGDYASKAKKSVAPHMTGNVASKGNRLDLRPTLGHYALAAMEQGGLVHHWVQQNHDRLAQKAGYPQEKINEIHGAWGDHNNPVVAMSGSLRSDLYEWWEEWCERADVCVVVGTSLAGMNADSLPRSVGNKNENLVIIGLTPTGLDHIAGVRIWGLLDDVLEKLARKLRLGKVPSTELKRKGDLWISQHPGCRFNTPIRNNVLEKKKEEEKAKKAEANKASSSSGARGSVAGGAGNKKPTPRTTAGRKQELSGSRRF